MRKIALSALMISLAVLLSACGSTAGYEKKIEQFRDTLSEYGRVSFQTEMSADDGECVSTYSVQCTRGENETVLNLLSPELIAGVTAHISKKGTEIEYDGLSLEAGTLSGSGIAPLEAPAEILDAMSGGIVSQIRRETQNGEDTIAFNVDRGNGIIVALWLEYNELTPVCAEICSSGRTVIWCKFSDWKME